MTEKEQKDLLKEHEDLKDKVKSLEKDIESESRFSFISILILVAFLPSMLVHLCYFCKEKNKTDEDLYSKNEELRKIICDIHKDTNTPAPKYDFKANKFVTSGYKYDPNLVKKLKELCKSNTH